MHYYIDLGVLGDINTYSLCAGIGIASMLFLLLLAFKKNKYDEGRILFVLLSVIASFLFGICFSILTNALFFLKANGKFKYSGINFYGAIIGGAIFYLVSVILYGKKHELPKRAELINIVVCPFVAFHFFGRIGCFMAGCCYGKPTDSPIGVVFPDNEILGFHHGGQAVIPTQLIEASFLLLLFIGLLFVKKHRELVYLTAYPTFRFIIEFFRGDERGTFISPVLSPAQWISLFLILVPAGYVVFGLVKRFKRAKETP